MGHFGSFRSTSKPVQHSSALVSNRSGSTSCRSGGSPATVSKRRYVERGGLALEAAQIAMVTSLDNRRLEEARGATASIEVMGGNPERYNHAFDNNDEFLTKSSVGHLADGLQGTHQP